MFDSKLGYVFLSLAPGVQPWYHPDFDSPNEQNRPQTLANKGVAALTHCHKCVGNSSFFAER